MTPDESAIALARALAAGKSPTLDLDHLKTLVGMLPGYSLREGFTAVRATAYSDAEKWVHDVLYPLTTGKSNFSPYASVIPVVGWTPATLTHHLSTYGIPTRVKDTDPVGTWAIEPVTTKASGVPWTDGRAWLVHPTVEISDTFGNGFVQSRPVERTSDPAKFRFATTWKASKSFVNWSHSFTEALQTLIARVDEKNLLERAKDTTTGECQVCGGRFAVGKNGLVAKHGYHHEETLLHGSTGRGRWGDGYMGPQIGNCFGSRELPWEVSRVTLGRYIQMVVTPDVDQCEQAFQQATTTVLSKLPVDQVSKNRSTGKMETTTLSSDNPLWAQEAKHQVEQAKWQWDKAKLRLARAQARYDGWKCQR